MKEPIITLKSPSVDMYHFQDFGERVLVWNTYGSSGCSLVGMIWYESNKNKYFYRFEGAAHGSKPYETGDDALTAMMKRDSGHWLRRRKASIEYIDKQRLTEMR